MVSDKKRKAKVKDVKIGDDVMIKRKKRREIKGIWMNPEDSETKYPAQWYGMLRYF